MPFRPGSGRRVPRPIAPMSGFRPGSAACGGHRFLDASFAGAFSLFLVSLRGLAVADIRPVAVEDHVRGVAGELLAEEHGREVDVVRLDAPDAERVEELLPVLAVAGHERVVGGGVVEDAARVAVDVREHEVDVVLGEGLERHALDQDPAGLLVHALGVCLLLRAVRVAVEHAGAVLVRGGAVLPLLALVLAARDEERVGLDGDRVGELRAVVRDDDGEEPLEEHRPRGVPEPPEDLRARLGTLRVADEAQREVVLVEDEREDVPPVPLLALEPVHLGLAVSERGVGDPVRDQVLVGSPDAALGVGLRDGARLPRLARAGEGEVAPDGVERLQVHVVVHGALAEAEEVRVVRHDVPHGMPLARASREHLVDPRELLVGGVNAPARLVEQPLVVGLGSAGDVELLRQRAAPLPLAAVAGERRRRQAAAGARQEVGAGLDAADAALAELPHPAVDRAHLGAPAGAVERACGARRPAHALVAVDSPVLDLPGDGAVGPPELARDLRDQPPQPEQSLYLDAVRVVHVLCHVVVSFLVPVGKGRAERPSACCVRFPRGADGIRHLPHATGSVSPWICKTKRNSPLGGSERNHNP